jgi:pimeloyl-ACP methyl ester carboxylesterase
VETQFVESPDGRALAWSEIGRRDGPVVVWCHGGLSGRLDVAFAAAGAIASGVRLITVDRPGLGESTRHKGRTVAGWAKDVAVVADGLGIDHFSVIGWSAGGPHALACAALLPDRVRATATIGSMEPVRDRAARRALGLRVDRMLIPLSRHASWLARAIVAVSTRLSAERQQQVLLRALSDADRRVLEPRPAEDVVGATLAAVEAGAAGVVDDYRAFGAPDWGFELAQISGPVCCWQGADDAAVPVAIGQRLAAAIPGARLEVVPDAGHYLVAEHGPEVFARLLADASA